MSSFAYSFAHYGNMIRDRGRVEPYARALQAAIASFSEESPTVLDLGCGFGFFAILAARFGAKQVYAIDPNPAIAAGNDLVQVAEVSDRITFFPQRASEVRLPSPVDVTIFDLRGPLPLFGDHIPVLIDARERFLARNGILIPQRDRLYAALISAPELYVDCQEPWRSQPCGIDLSPARTYAVNTWRKARFRTEQCLTAPQQWAVLEYATVATPDFSGELSWQLERAGTASGLGLWFETDLWAEIGFSNAPGQPDLVYGKAFFPWQEEVALQPGDRVVVHLQAKWLGGDYLWQWRSRVTRGAICLANFQQSTFFATPHAAAELVQQSDRYRPQLSPAGQAARCALNGMAAGQSVGEIAAAIAEQFPQQFPQRLAALRYVAELAARYG